MRELVSIKFCSIARVTRFEYPSIHFLNYFGYYFDDRFRRTILETNLLLLSNPSLRPAPLEQVSKGRDPITHYRHTLLSTPNFQLKGNGYSSSRRWKPAPRSRRNKSRAIEEDNNPTPPLTLLESIMRKKGPSQPPTINRLLFLPPSPFTFPSWVSEISRRGCWPSPSPLLSPRGERAGGLSQPVRVSSMVRY